MTMEAIFHEKQEGSLCAQHCLNALLQGSYFTPVDLATLAQRMDDEERIRMAESGYDSEEYRQFLEQPSGNMDDSGYFSVQVISSALEVWNLDLIPYNSTEPRATLAQLQPSDMQAFICNYRDHWFTIRKLGYQWFNLNSLLSGPELISNTYLAMFLAQLQQEGYSIFVVVGPLPANAADDVLRLRPATQRIRPTVNAAATMTDKDPQLERAIRMSLGQSRDSSDTDDLETALTMSLLDEDDEEQMRQALRLSLQADGEPDLQRALNMNVEVESVTSTSCEMQLDPAEVRRRRLAFLDNLHTQDSPTTKLNT